MPPLLLALLQVMAGAMFSPSVFLLPVGVLITFSSAKGRAGQDRDFGIFPHRTQIVDPSPLQPLMTSEFDSSRLQLVDPNSSGRAVPSRPTLLIALSHLEAVVSQ